LDSFHEALAKESPNIFPLDNKDLVSLYTKSYSCMIPLFFGVFGTEFKMTMEDPAILSSNRESFNVIHLPIPISASSLTITELLQRFVEYEYIPTMKEYQFFRKCFLHLPPVLILSLKRFSAKGNQKNTAFIHGFDEPIDLGFLLKTNQSCYYRLEAVINHFGSMEGGHYTATIRKGRSWVVVDDAHSFSALQKDVVTSNAYCFLLRRFSLDI
jgi:ubiquitin C-terminal hydrolase